MKFEVLTHTPFEPLEGESDEVEWGSVIIGLRIENGLVVIPHVKYGIHAEGNIHLNVRRLPDSEIDPRYEVIALIEAERGRELLADVIEKILIKHKWDSPGEIDSNTITVELTFGELYGKATFPYFIRRDNTVIFQRQWDLFTKDCYRVCFEMTLTEKQKEQCFKISKRYLEIYHPRGKCAI